MNEQVEQVEPEWFKAGISVEVIEGAAAWKTCPGCGRKTQLRITTFLVPTVIDLCRSCAGVIASVLTSMGVNR